MFDATRVAVRSGARSTETIRADGEWRKKSRIYYCTKRRDELYGCEKERASKMEEFSASGARVYISIYKVPLLLLLCKGHRALRAPPHVSMALVVVVVHSAGDFARLLRSAQVAFAAGQPE